MKINDRINPHEKIIEMKNKLDKTKFKNKNKIKQKQNKNKNKNNTKQNKIK